MIFVFFLIPLVSVLALVLGTLAIFLIFTIPAGIIVVATARTLWELSTRLTIASRKMPFWASAALVAATMLIGGLMIGFLTT